MMTRLLGVLSLTLLLGGCAVGPDYVRPELEAEIPSQWSRPTLASALGDSADDSSWRWWEDFADPELNLLVDQALAHNHDLAAAAGRVLEAQALLGGSRSSRWPTIEVGGSATRSKSSTVQTFGFIDPYRNVYSLSANLKYEADLWGRLSRGREAALTTLLASEHDRRALAQGLIAGVVRAWLQNRELEMQVHLNRRTVKNFQRNLDLVQSRYERGLVTALDVHLAAQNLASAQAAGPALEQSLVLNRRQLEILVGRFPAGQILAPSSASSQDPLPEPRGIPQPLQAVPAHLPSQLLERRPDLAAAELRLHSSVARVGEAKAALFPRLSLTGSAGSTSYELSDLLTEPSNIWSLAGNLFMPLINRGATQAQIKAAQARSTQAVAAYRSAVLQAFAEVENALDQDHYQGQQEEYLQESVRQARLAVERAESRYQRGLEGILTTLESQRRLYSAESSLLTTQRLHRTARVNLIQALGGDWDRTEYPSPETYSQGADQ